MKFWDSSALVPLLVEEASTPPLTALYLREEAILTWWATEVECASAIARLEREGRLSAQDTALAFQRLELLARSWHRVEPGETLLRTAKRLLRVHDLRAADSMQLAAAFLASEHQPHTLGFICFDRRLALAAEREGFLLVNQDGL